MKGDIMEREGERRLCFRNSHLIIVGSLASFSPVENARANDRVVEVLPRASTYVLRPLGSQGGLRAAQINKP